MFVPFCRVAAAFGSSSLVCGEWKSRRASSAAHKENTCPRKRERQPNDPVRVFLKNLEGFRDSESCRKFGVAAGWGSKEPGLAVGMPPGLLYRLAPSLLQVLGSPLFTVLSMRISVLLNK